MPLQSSLNQLKQQQHLLQLGIFTLVIVVVWIGVSLLRSQSKTQVDTTLQKLALPLTPSINADVIDRLEKKAFFSEAELAAFPIYTFLETDKSLGQRVVTLDEAASLAPSSLPATSPTPSPTAAPTPIPTPSPSPNQTFTSESATDGASLSPQLQSEVDLQ